jgi:hypothetical protein
MTAHGSRTLASSLLHELGRKSDVVERQLTHIEQNAIKGAYNRAEHLPERTDDARLGRLLGRARERRGGGPDLRVRIVAKSLSGAKSCLPLGAIQQH